MTPTFQALLWAERANPDCNERKAYTRALSVYSFLSIAPTMDKPDLPIPSRTIKTRRAALRRAGLAPITTPEALADLAEDLGVADETALVRILWLLHDSKIRSRAAALRRWRGLIDATIEKIVERASGGLDQRPSEQPAADLRRMAAADVRAVRP